MTGPGKGTASAATEWSKDEYPHLFDDGETAYTEPDLEPGFGGTPDIPGRSPGSPR